jgi:hypothetical protein
MNWRKGKIKAVEARFYSAFGSEEARLATTVPLSFFNRGPIPRVIRNLRMIHISEGISIQGLFTATSEKIGSDEGPAPRKIKRAFRTGACLALTRNLEHAY